MKLSFSLSFAAIAVAVAFSAPAGAQVWGGYQTTYAQQAVPGIVVTVQPVARQVQRPPEGGYAGNSRAVIGGALGGIVGMIAGRHAANGWMAAAAGTAIGSAIGAQRDRAATYSQQATEVVALEVVIKTANGIMALPTTDGQRFFPGQRVYIVGNTTIIPAG